MNQRVHFGIRHQLSTFTCAGFHVVILSVNDKIGVRFNFSGRDQLYQINVMVNHNFLLAKWRSTKLFELGRKADESINCRQSWPMPRFKWTWAILTAGRKSWRSQGEDVIHLEIGEPDFGSGRRRLQTPGVLAFNRAKTGLPLLQGLPWVWNVLISDIIGVLPSPFFSPQVEVSGRTNYCHAWCIGGFVC